MRMHFKGKNLPFPKVTKNQEALKNWVPDFPIAHIGGSVGTDREKDASGFTILRLIVWPELFFNTKSSLFSKTSSKVP
jgi:hypothetical protein